MKRVILTGSRRWTDAEKMTRILHALHTRFPDAVLVHGACPSGADLIGDRIWRQHGGLVERHPADWDTHGKAAGPIRNQKMAQLGADLCLAFPLEASKGTRGMVHLARRADIPVYIVRTRLDMREYVHWLDGLERRIVV